MAEQTGRVPDGTVFRDGQGNLKVFRDGAFHDTDELALQTGAGDAALIAAGETTSKIIGNAASQLFDPAALADAGLAPEPELTRSLRAEHPIATAAGDALPFVGAGVATGGSLPALVATEAALGGLAAGNIEGAAIGGAAALGFGAAGNVASNMLRARGARQGAGQTIAADVADLTPNARPDRATRQARAFDEPPRISNQAATGAGGNAGAAATRLHAQRVGQADQLGFELPTGDRLNSDTMRQIESGMRSSPDSPPHLRTVARHNQENLNALWGDAMGAGKTTKITPDVMGRARENAAAEYQRAAELAGTVDTRGVPRMVGEMRAARGQSLIQDETVQKLLGDLTDFESQPGGMAARDFMAQRAEFNLKMRQAATQGDGLLTQAYNDVINAMDEAFEGSAGPEAAAIYNAAREHTRFIIALERGKGVNLDKGNVNPTTAGASLRKTFKVEAGRGDPGDLSDAGVDAIEGTSVANYFADTVGDSGTATRLMAAELIRNPARLAQSALARGIGEGYDRIVAPAIERFGGPKPTPAPPGPFPLDIGGPTVPGGPLDI